MVRRGAAQSLAILSEALEGEQEVARTFLLPILKALL